MTNFITHDCEGHEVKGVHRLVLYANSKGEHIFNRDGLGYRDILPKLARYEDYSNVWYSFGYDVNMIFKDLDFELKKKLFQEGRKTDIEVNGEVYTVKYIAKKILTIVHNQHTYTHYDAFGFFQEAFIKACKKWAIPMNDDLIEKGKKLRGQFEKESEDFIIAYNDEECRALNLMMQKLATYIEKAGIPELRSWHGAGAIASRFLNMWQVDQHKPKEIFKELALARRFAYFGGRSELFFRGQVGQTIYHYDINSAYPTACLYLPSLRDKTFIHYEKRSQINDIAKDDFGLLKCKWDITSRVGCLPFRNKDNYVLFPTRGEGWYHNVEVQTAIEKGYKIQVQEAYILEKPYDYFLKEGIDSMGKKRLELKKKKDMGNIPIKLGLNSLYGKLAQRPLPHEKPDGSIFWKYGQYMDLYWAGFITAFARSQLLKYMDISTVVMCATDALFSKTPLDCPIGENLGQWEYTEHKDAIFIQSGVYAVEDADGWHVKNRGYTGMSHEQFKDIYRRQLKGELVQWKERRFVGNKLALTSASYKMCEFQDLIRVINWNNNKKRLFINLHEPSDSIPTTSTGFSKIYDPKGLEELEKEQQDVDLDLDTELIEDI